MQSRGRGHGCIEARSRGQIIYRISNVERGWAVADRDVTQAPSADPRLARLYDMAERAARDGRKGRWAETPK